MGQQSRPASLMLVGHLVPDLPALVGLFKARVGLEVMDSLVDDPSWYKVVITVSAAKGYNKIYPT